MADESVDARNATPVRKRARREGVGTVASRPPIDHELPYGAMLDAAHDAIFLWEAGGPIVYWNRGAELLYGYTADQAIGRRTHDLLQTRHPESPQAFEAHLLQVGEWAGELTHIARDGSAIDVLSRHQTFSMSAEPAENGASARVYILETARDITARKREEARTRAALQALLEMAQALVERPPSTLEEAAAAQQATRRLEHRLAEVACEVLACLRVGLLSIERETGQQRALAVVGLTPEQ
jgi:PAS domain S-box-containing protein